MDRWKAERRKVRKVRKGKKGKERERERERGDEDRMIEKHGFELFLG